jgi:hypothetical protein
MKDARGHGSNARGAMPLKGHDYHTKSDSELRFITKDASEAAKNMQGMGNGRAEGKYLDQANDAQTVLGYRARGGSRVSSDADAARTLASGPKSAPAPVHDSMASGERRENRLAKNAAVRAANKEKFSKNRRTFGPITFQAMNGRN